MERARAGADERAQELGYELLGRLTCNRMAYIVVKGPGHPVCYVCGREITKDPVSISQGLHRHQRCGPGSSRYMEDLRPRHKYPRTRKADRKRTGADDE